MQLAARESFPDFRRYLRAKARALGVSALAWYDLFAPVGASGRAWSFDESAAFVIEQFGTYSERMRAFAERAFRERWIDAEPRPGKEDGAFCMWLVSDQSRVLANFKPAFGGMSTLAHELGHGYHNMCLAPRTPLQRATPMTLAETASIFCETIVRQGARPPYRGAAKSHYYSPSRWFYTSPYMSGLLLGLGLYARSTADLEGFKAGYDELPSFSFVPKYDELLSRTGMAGPAELASEF